MIFFEFLLVSAMHKDRMGEREMHIKTGSGQDAIKE